jgi:integrase/recombinase XerD
VVLIADALCSLPVEVDRSVIPGKDGYPTMFRPLRDDYLASCRRRGNAEATVVAKDKVASRFLGYLNDVGVDDLAVLGVPELSGFFLRQRGLRRKTVAAMRSCVADFLDFLASAGRAPQGLADRLPPHRHVRHESEPHPWTADEIRRLLAVIDRQSVTGKRDYAMILATARLGLRISDLRQLELGDLDWRSKTITIVQHKTGRPLSLPLLDDVGWAFIDYVRSGRPETACSKVFVKHRHPFDAFGCASSIASRLSRHAARAGITSPPGEVCGMHSLRGALAIAMIGNGASMPVVSAVLGHASTDTTQAYYLRFDVERLRCCALDVEDIIEKAGARHA